MPNPMLAPILRWLGKLSYPKLFLLTGVLFVISVIVPDPIPFVDELVFGLATLLLANRKLQDARPEQGPGTTIDGESERH